MKLSQQARAYINTILATAESGNEEVRIALAFALASKYVKSQIDKENETDSGREFRNRTLCDINEINQEVILRFDLEETVKLVRSLYLWRASVGAELSKSPKAFECTEFPLAGILGLSGYVSNDVIKSLCHPMVPKYLAGWNAVLACK